MLSANSKAVFTYTGCSVFSVYFFKSQLLKYSITFVLFYDSVEHVETAEISWFTVFNFL